MELRKLLWPDVVAETERRDLANTLLQPQKFATFIVRDEAGKAIAFADVSVRLDYVNGCDGSPVAFLEGLYVRSEFRRQGIARALIGRCEVWAREHECTELASDASLENNESHQMHSALGFTETERVVFFHKRLD